MPSRRRVLPATAAAVLSALLGVAAASPTAGAPATTSSRPSGIPGSSGANWLTYHGDAQRSGNVPGQPPAGTLEQAWRASFNGQVFAEPLVDGNRVIVATENDTVYSLDASSGAVVWSNGVGTPVPGGQLPCGDVDPSGITGTPVIDQAAGLVLVVAFVEPGRHELVALDLKTGRVRWRETIGLPGVDPLAQQQRGALALDGGRVYVPFGGLYGDCGNFRGFLVSFPAATPGAQATWAAPARRSGVWAPPGPVVAADGSIFIADGNGASSSTFDDSDAVLRLTPGLKQTGVFAPSNWQELDQGDLDLGATSPTLLGREVFQVGRSGVGYLLDASALGGVGGERFSAPVCAGEGAAGATAVDGSVVLVPCHDALTAVRVGPGATFSVLWSQPSLAQATAVVAGGKVWALTRRGEVAEVDEATGTVDDRQIAGAGATSFPALAVASGRLYAAAGNTLVAFGGV